MAVGTAAAIGIGGAALLGGIAGSQGKHSSQTTRRDVAPASADEREAGQIAQNQLRELRDLITQGGPNRQDVQSGSESARALAARLEQFAEGGAMPSHQQLQQAQALGEAQFAPQQVAFEQSLDEQERQAARLAGQIGRTQSDPILQAKLAQIRAQGTERIQAARQQFVSQTAQQLPMQQLQMLQQAAQVRSGLASQALSNRQTLLGLGQGIQAQGMNFRAGTASTTQTARSGGGLAGAITGAMGGAGAGLNIASAFGGFGGAGGGAGGGGGASVGGTGQAAGFGNVAQPGF